jgi:hypothetical protein
MNLYRYTTLMLGAFALAACTAASPATPAAPADTGAVSSATIQINAPWARAMKMEGAMAGMEEPTPTAGMEEPAMEPGEGMEHSGMEMAGANSAAYMVIRNTGSAPDKLIAARSDVAKTVEIHTVIEENGMMQMRPVEGGIEIPAGGEVELKPGGYHVMLIGLTRDMNAGETVQITLQFETAGEIPITAEIRQP